jgi:hypothetical protein
MSRSRAIYQGFGLNDPYLAQFNHFFGLYLKIDFAQVGMGYVGY